jgi:hypothetical protein
LGREKIKKKIPLNNILFLNLKESNVFNTTNWKYPKIEDGKPTKYNWIVQNLDGLNLGFNTDIGAFSYINAKYKVIIEI